MELIGSIGKRGLMAFQSRLGLLLPDLSEARRVRSLPSGQRRSTAEAANALILVFEPGLTRNFTPPEFLAAIAPEVDGRIRSASVCAVKPATT
jgi:hypothetical protein